MHLLILSAHDNHGLDLCRAHHRCGKGTSDTSPTEGDNETGGGEKQNKNTSCDAEKLDKYRS